MTTETVTIEERPLSPEDREGARAAAIRSMLTRDVKADTYQPITQLGAPERCQAFQTGLQIGRLIALQDDLDDLGTAGDRDASASPRLSYERAAEQSARAADLLRQAAPFHIASSMEGALAHVVIAGAAVVDMTEDPSLDAAGLRALAVSARRCIYSAARVLSLATGVPLRTLAAHHFLSSSLDDVARAWSLPAMAGSDSPPFAPFPISSPGPVRGSLESPLGFTSNAGTNDHQGELADLGQRWQRANAAYRAALDAQGKAEDAFACPPVPEALLRQQRDEGLGLARFASHRGAGIWWYCIGPAGDTVQTASKLRTLKDPRPKIAERAREIVVASDAYASAFEAAERESGLIDLRRQTDLCCRAVRDIEAIIETRRGKSFDDLLVKARIAENDFVYEREPNETLLKGLVCELIALAGHAPAVGAVARPEA